MKEGRGNGILVVAGGFGGNHIPVSVLRVHYLDNKVCKKFIMMYLYSLGGKLINKHV